MSTVLDSRYQELVTQLSECTLFVCKDRAFGDAEYSWVNNDLNIIAEAYTSSQIADFWTCPPNYWVLSDPNIPTWEHGSDYNLDLQLKYSGTIVYELLKLYSKQKIGYNDAG